MAAWVASHAPECTELTVEGDRGCGESGANREARRRAPSRDLLVMPGAATSAFDINLRNAPTIGGQKLDNYLGGSTLTAMITLTACPAMVAPCGFD
jgi:Asp-tRNA(Asn)/Glu-tRNA(Gln) amidotransferase A subunit family amidase